MHKQIVLLPAPVLPTTPIFSPFFIEKLKLSKTVSVVGLYFKLTWLNCTSPFSGQLGLLIRGYS